MTGAQLKDLHTWNKLREKGWKILDARSPSEFSAGHIPGAYNLPLLNDEQRHAVGITYKTSGQQAAVRKGFELTGHEFAAKIDLATKLAGNGPVLMYCWRGGLRSQILAWILSTAGVDVHVLEGGYKAWRNSSLLRFTEKRKLLILSGKTGTGKTEILHHLRERGEHILDIEALCHHRGSSFGALGQEEQPTQEQFENLLAEELILHPHDTTLWVEDESRFLGRLRIPDPFFDQMSEAPVIAVERPMDIRIQRILQDYGHFPVELLVERTMALSKRMGSEQATQASELLLSGSRAEWVTQLLVYYDKSYTHFAKQREEHSTTYLSFDHESETYIAERLITHRKENHV